jgi:glycerophosphoryl diester phosphodiesterase
VRTRRLALWAAASAALASALAAGSAGNAGSAVAGRPPAVPTKPSTATVAIARPPDALATFPRRVPLVIAHRGASAYAPENTLDSFRIAIGMGADYLEADLVPTRDGVLVARHENELSATTDVARHPEFANRRRTKQISGVRATGWFTEDFTLAEVRTLHAVERTGRVRPAEHPAAATVPTVDELIALARTEGAARGRQIGLYLEMKAPAYFASIGLAVESRLAEALQHAGLNAPGVPVFIESFEAESLRTLHRLVAVPLIQLLWGPGSPGDPATAPAALVSIGEYAAGIGVDRARVRQPAPPDENLVQLAHRYRLEVHAFTFGDEPAEDYQAFYRLGVDGVFTDNPDTALRARA